MKSLNVFYACALAASMTLAAPAMAQQKEVKIKTEKLSDTIYVLSGKGGNIGVSAGADGVFIIDDKFAVMTDQIKAILAEISDKPVNYVINTHWHFDHTGGNENFGKSGSAIIAHDNVRKRMKTGGYIAAAGKTFDPSPDVALPVITFNDSMSLHLNGEEARLIHVKSAHTDGDGIIFFKDSNIVHMGDAFVSRNYPFIDRASGGSVDGIIEAARIVLSMSDAKTQIIPGHGAVTDIVKLKAYMEMNIHVRAKITAMKKKGMSLEDVFAADPLSEVKEVWGRQSKEWNDRFVSAIYDGAE